MISIQSFWFQILSDARFVVLIDKINEIIHEDTRYQKGTLNMRTQKCFAVKVSFKETTSCI